MKINVTFQPKGKTFSVRTGENVLQCALKNRIVINHRCNGNGSCTTCKIKVLSAKANVSDPSVSEIRLVGEEALAEGVRLACQTRIYGSVEVYVLEQAWKTKVKRILEQPSDPNEGI
jgi:ferredoxin, 2Fe-2S